MRVTDVRGTAVPGVDAQMRRRRGRAAMVGLALCLLAACGGGGGEQAVGEGEGEAAGGGELNGNLVVWDWQSESWGETLEELNQRFLDEHPGVTIERVVQPFDEYNQLVQTANSGRSGPDVLMLLPGGGTLNFASALTPLNERIDDEMRDSLLGWESVSQGFDPEQGILATPIGLQGMVYWYNKALFEQAGLDPEEPLATFDELLSAGDTLKSNGVVPLGGGNAEGALTQWMFSLVWPAVGSPEEGLALARGEIAFTDPLVEEAAGMYVQLIEGEYFSPGFASTPISPDALEQFKAGEQAITPGLAAEFYSYPDFNEALGEENVGVLPPLGEEGGPQYYPAGPAVAWGIPQYSQNPDLAWEYIRFLTMDEQAVRAQFDQSGVLPNNQRVDVTEGAPPQVATTTGWFAEGPTQLPVHQLFAQPVLDEFVRQMELVITGDAELADALAATQAVQEEYTER